MSEQIKKWVKDAEVVEDRKKSRDILTKAAYSLAKKPVNREQFQHCKFDGKHQVLTYAVINGHQFLFDQLLTVLQIDPNIPHDFDGTIPLHHAAACGRIQMLERLVERHSYIEAVDKGNSTPLCFAVAYNQNATLLKLLNYGASTDVESFLGQPIHIAVLKGNIDALQMLNEKNPSIVNSELYGFCTPLVTAAVYKSIDCFKNLIEVADLNVQPLMYKIICCFDSEETSLECICILINHGLNPNLYDEDTLLETLPIICAAKKGWKSVIERLLNLTDPIPGVEWTANGILQYVNSEPFKEGYATYKQTRVSCLKQKLIDELKAQHYLAADVICKVLCVDMDEEEWDRFQSLCSFLIKFGRESMFPDFNALTIQALSCLQEDNKTLLQGAKACLALEPESEIFRQFLADVERTMEECNNGMQ